MLCWGHQLLNLIHMTLSPFTIILCQYFNNFRNNYWLIYKQPVLDTFMELKKFHRTWFWSQGMGDLDLKEKDYVWNQPKREVKLRIIDLIAQIEPRAKHFTYIIWCNHRNNFPRQLWLSTRQQRKLLRNLPKVMAGKCQSWCSTLLLPDVKALCHSDSWTHRSPSWWGLNT